MRPFTEILPELRQGLLEIEQRRIDTLNARSTGYKWIAAVLVLIALAAYLSAVSFQTPVAAIVVGIVGLITLFVIYSSQISSPFQDYRRHFKAQFIGPLLNTVASDIQYFPAGDHAILNEYRASQLFSPDYDRYNIEDTIYGRVGETELSLSEIHTEYKTESRDKDGRKKTTWHTIFKGLFLSADFHKDFHGLTFVRTDVAERSLGVLGRFFQKTPFSSIDLVQLENPEFEREFVVHSSDQVESRYILSTSMMERMVDLKKRFSTKVEFSFVSSRVYIAITTNQAFFEPLLQYSLLDEAYLQDYHHQMRSCMSIVEDLGLNVRIWSKQ